MTPFDAYTARAARFAALRATEAARWSRIANLRLVVALAALAIAGLGLWQNAAPLLWLAGAIAIAFLALVAYHNRLKARRDHFAALHDQSLEGLARLRRDWAALPLRQPAAVPADHPTAADLDLLGPRSLQHLLNTARSPAGLATIQRWLLTPAPPAVVATRQAAVSELAPQLDLRDDLAALAAQAGESQGRYEAFAVWARATPWLIHRPLLLWVARLSAASLALAAAAQLFGLTALPFWALFLPINILITALTSRSTAETLAQLHDRGELLAAYAALYERLSAAPVASPELRRLQAALGSGDLRADRRLRLLSRYAAAAELSRSLLYPVLQLGLLWSIHVVDLAERWRMRSGEDLQRWLDALGDWEALAALAALSHDHPSWCFPALEADGQPALVATALAHPLLPPERAVSNDVTIGPPGSFLLITGSNMSGKSTLLRSVGLAVSMAQAGGPVCAAALQLPPLTLATSMRVQDSLAQGVSYFMAELRRLKEVVDAAEAAVSHGPLVIYLLDEILHGTNSAERLVAARQIIARLIRLGAIGAVSTHDLALAEGSDLAAQARLAHFSEHFAEGPEGLEMRFDYHLRPGLAQTTNALRLMELVGLPLDEHGPTSATKKN